MRRGAWLALVLAACAREGGAAPWLTAPSPAEHGARWFPIAAGTPHGVATCDDCHGAFDTFARFDCLHCHAGAHADEAALALRHAAMAGYRFASDACYGCHARGLAVDHAALFPIASGAHAGVSCAECHVDPADRRALGCAGCHGHGEAAMAGAHAAVADYAFASASCLRCHADAQVQRMADHRPFLIVAPGKHLGAAAACLRCHPASRDDKPFAADFSAADCLACHDRLDTDAHHAEVAGYRPDTAACLGCHPTGVRGEAP